VSSLTLNSQAARETPYMKKNQDAVIPEYILTHIT